MACNSPFHHDRLGLQLERRHVPGTRRLRGRRARHPHARVRRASCSGSGSVLRWDSRPARPSDGKDDGAVGVRPGSNVPVFQRADRSPRRDPRARRSRGCVTSLPPSRTRVVRDGRRGTRSGARPDDGIAIRVRFRASVDGLRRLARRPRPSRGDHLSRRREEARGDRLTERPPAPRRRSDTLAIGDRDILSVGPDRKRQDGDHEDEIREVQRGGGRPGTERAHDGHQPARGRGTTPTGCSPARNGGRDGRDVSGCRRTGPLVLAVDDVRPECAHGATGRGLFPLRPGRSDRSTRRARPSRRRLRGRGLWGGRRTHASRVRAFLGGSGRGVESPDRRLQSGARYDERRRHDLGGASRKHRGGTRAAGRHGDGGRPRRGRRDPLRRGKRVAHSRSWNRER